MTNSQSIQIRTANDADVIPITDIFNYYIANTHARFEEQPLTYENRQQWFSQFKDNSKYQIFVACQGEQVLGFACSQPYRPMPGFSESVEVTIYLAAHLKGKGVGSQLYEQLFKALENQPVHSIISGIALPNEASIALHRKFGFREVGVFNEYAKKQGKYISSVWFEKLTQQPSD